MANSIFMLQACLQNGLFFHWSRLLVSESMTTLHGSSLSFHVCSVQCLSFCAHQLGLSAVIWLMWCDVMSSSRVFLRSIKVMAECISLSLLSLHQLSLTSFCCLMSRWCVVQGFHNVQSCQYKVRAQAAWLVNLATTFLPFFTLLLWSNC